MTAVEFPCLNIGCDQPRDWTVTFVSEDAHGQLIETEIDTCAAHLAVLIEMVGPSGPTLITIMKASS